MGINDYLWGGGGLEAPSPEATAPMPPSDEEIRQFVETRQLEASHKENNRIYRDRVGGGVRVCVFEFDVHDPQNTVDQVILLRKNRDEYPMPFDE